MELGVYGFRQPWKLCRATLISCSDVDQPSPVSKRLLSLATFPPSRSRLIATALATMDSLESDRSSEEGAKNGPSLAAQATVILSFPLQNTLD